MVLPLLSGLYVSGIGGASSGGASLRSSTSGGRAGGSFWSTLVGWTGSVDWPAKTVVVVGAALIASEWTVDAGDCRMAAGVLDAWSQPTSARSGTKNGSRF